MFIILMRNIRLKVPVYVQISGEVMPKVCHSLFMIYEHADIADSISMKVQALCLSRGDERFGQRDASFFK